MILKKKGRERVVYAGQIRIYVLMIRQVDMRYVKSTSGKRRRLPAGAKGGLDKQELFVLVMYFTLARSVTYTSHCRI